MYKENINKLKLYEHDLENLIKTETNLLNYYENLFNQEREDNDKKIDQAIIKIKGIKAKIWFGNIFFLQTILVGLASLILAPTSSALVVPSLVMAAGSVLLNYNAKKNCIKKDELIKAVNDCIEKKKECIEVLKIARERIETLQNKKDMVSNKINELSNAQEFYERTSKKYAFKTNFSKTNEHIIEK